MGVLAAGAGAAERADVGGGALGGSIAVAPLSPLTMTWSPGFRPRLENGSSGISARLFGGYPDFTASHNGWWRGFSIGYYSCAQVCFEGRISDSS